MHTSLPQLKSVVLERVHLYPNDNISNISPISVKPLKVFSLVNFMLVTSSTDATDAISNWISYIGACYRNLEELKLESDEYGEFVDVDKNIVQQSLKVALTKLMQLSSFSWFLRSFGFCVENNA